MTFKKAPDGRFLRLCASGRRPARGFTLIELVTAIVIVSVLSAVAAPYILDTRAFSERGYVNEVAFALRYTQKIAVASNCSARLAIDATGYVGTQQATCGAGLWSTPIRRTDGGALQGPPPADVVMAPDATIVFNGDGSVAGAAPVLSVGAFTVTIDNSSSLVTVNP